MVNKRMRYKKGLLFGFIIVLLCPIINVAALTYIDNVKDGNFVFFLVDLEEGNHTDISLIHEENGNFTLFLFNKRPSKSFVKNDKSLDDKIFNHSALVAYSVEDNPNINYTAPETKIYYLEIILVSGGPDTFTLNCDRDLTRYYLPIISGFQLEYLIIVFIFSIGLITLLVYKKRRIL